MDTQALPLRVTRHLSLQATASQRMLVQGVLASTGMLVRGLNEGSEVAALRRLAGERRRLLRELGNSVATEPALGCFLAMTAAVCESDRALDQILGD